jgi:hypothetical protein
MENIFCSSKVLQRFDQIESKIILKEEKVKFSEIEIKGIPADTIIIKLDIDSRDYKQKSFYLDKSVRHIHKGCDYVMIIPSLRLILFVELKSNDFKQIDFVNQFRISKIFLEYCFNLNNYVQDEINNREFTNKYILFAKKYKYHFTDGKKVNVFPAKDLKGNYLNVISPGYPKRLDLRKLI